jgi:hypothetical protein
MQEPMLIKPTSSAGALSPGPEGPGTSRFPVAYRIRLFLPSSFPDSY